jgi:DedD protein
MAFFKFRKDGEEHAAPAPAPESIDTLRKRARYRLAGAAILVLAGVIGFPLLFDNQPRPIAVNIPIDIPDKAQSKPLSAPTPVVAAPASEAQVAASAAAQVKPAKSDLKEEVIIAGPTPKPAPAPKPAAKGAVSPDNKPQESKTKSAEAAKAQALLEGKSADSANPAAADGVRFVVQFGSYSDAGKAHEARVKVERAGLKTYSQLVQVADGKKYRVRVGPFERRAEAEKAAEKIKKLNLPVAILEL